MRRNDFERQKQDDDEFNIGDQSEIVIEGGKGDREDSNLK